MTEMASILIIDDEENLRRTLALILEHEGYLVTTAADVMHAKILLEDMSFELVLLDIKLPEIDGLTFLPELRRMCPNMAVLILTAHDKLESAAQAVHDGAIDYILKPVDPPVLLQHVKDVLADQENPSQGRKKYSHLQKLLKDQKLDKDSVAPD